MRGRSSSACSCLCSSRKVQKAVAENGCKERRQAVRVPPLTWKVVLQDSFPRQRGNAHASRWPCGSEADRRSAPHPPLTHIAHTLSPTRAELHSARAEDISLLPLDCTVFAAQTQTLAA